PSERRAGSHPSRSSYRCTGWSARTARSAPTAHTRSGSASSSTWRRKPLSRVADSRAPLIRAQTTRTPASGPPGSVCGCSSVLDGLLGSEAGERAHLHLGCELTRFLGAARDRADPSEQEAQRDRDDAG